MPPRPHDDLTFYLLFIDVLQGQQPQKDGPEMIFPLSLCNFTLSSCNRQHPRDICLVLALPLYLFLPTSVGNLSISPLAVITEVTECLSSSFHSLSAAPCFPFPLQIASLRSSLCFPVALLFSPPQTFDPITFQNQFL